METQSLETTGVKPTKCNRNIYRGSVCPNDAEAGKSKCTHHLELDRINQRNTLARKRGEKNLPADSHEGMTPTIAALGFKDEVPVEIPKLPPAYHPMQAYVDQQVAEQTQNHTNQKFKGKMGFFYLGELLRDSTKFTLGETSGLDRRERSHQRSRPHRDFRFVEVGGELAFYDLDRKRIEAIGLSIFGMKFHRIPGDDGKIGDWFDGCTRGEAIEAFREICRLYATKEDE